MKETALIIGAGLGLSASIARLCSSEGMKVILVSRNTDKLIDLSNQFDWELINCDVSKINEVAKLFKSTDQMLGFSRNFLIDNNIIKKNDQFIMTAGIPIGMTGSTNMIKVETI